MVRRDRVRTGRVGSLLLLAMLFGTIDARAGDGRLWLEERSDRTSVEMIVSRAVEDASEKLSSAACQEVFTDFRDAGGRTLQENLDGLGRSGKLYLEWLVFYNGQGRTRCEDRDTLASTSPDSRIIFICADQFVRTQHRDRGTAAALIIHEELHSLGLRENPPPSKEITAKVIARCGR